MGGGSHPSIIPAKTVLSIAPLLSTGKAPGKPRQVGQVFLFGS
jgi:hypothetical protein